MKEGWKKLPIGAIVEKPGTALDFQTGDWRSRRPIWHEEKCIHCLLCWVFCPDSAILLEGEKVKGVDLRYCKGCGICARECPPKANAIEMVDEADFR